MITLISMTIKIIIKRINNILNFNTNKNNKGMHRRCHLFSHFEAFEAQKRIEDQTKICNVKNYFNFVINKP